MIDVLLLALGALSLNVSAAGWPDLSLPGPEQGGGKDDVAVIVGVERYAFVSPVPGAARNALTIGMPVSTKPGHQKGNLGAGQSAGKFSWPAPEGPQPLIF
ncbi:MAG: hypothetical protein HY927_01610 [Elusimicrobia bacterium]|nr:hypothetical protein [Elusimicrobiota bacterium]